MRKQFEELHPLFDLEKDEQGEYTCVLTRVTWLGFELGKKTLQAEIDQLKAELALCREENKGLVGRVSDLKKHSEMLRAAANSWTYSEGEKNILLSQADDLDRILNGEKTLRGES